MEIDRAHCCICDRFLITFNNNLAVAKTSFSNTPLFEVLERLLNEKLADPEQCCCDECAKKLNDYDLATLTAMTIENELSILYRKKNSMYYLEDDDGDGEGEEHLLTGNIELKNEETFRDGDEAELAGDNEEVDHILLELIETENENHDENGEQVVEYLYDVIEEGDEDAVTPEPVTPRTNSRRQPRTEPVDDSEHSDVVVTKVGEGKKSICLKCNVVFNTKIERTRHMKTHRKKNGLVCGICGRTYKSKAALDIHVGMHSGISPHECQVCGKQFTQKGALVRHMPMHTGEHPYQVSEPRQTHQNNLIKLSFISFHD